MLVLSRKQGQRIVVGNDVYITVVAIQSNQVRLGITAPAEVPVHREEVYHLLQASAHAGAENAESSAPPASARINAPAATSHGLSFNSQNPSILPLAT